jgi:phage head maturation protease
MFEITREEWQFSEDPKVLDKRVIQEVRLYEAGPVLFPAYPETSVGVRSTADLAYERARRQWEERNRPEKPVVIVSPDPFLLRVRVLRAA